MIDRVSLLVLEHNYDQWGAHCIEHVWYADPVWFSKHIKEIAGWITDHGCRWNAGTIIRFPDKDTLLMFLLRWGA
jgi:hypothetical protein